MASNKGFGAFIRTVIRLRKRRGKNNWFRKKYFFFYDGKDIIDGKDITDGKDYKKKISVGSGRDWWDLPKQFIACFNYL